MDDRDHEQVPGASIGELHRPGALLHHLFIGVEQEREGFTATLVERSLDGHLDQAPLAIQARLLVMEGEDLVLEGLEHRPGQVGDGNAGSVLAPGCETTRNIPLPPPMGVVSTSHVYSLKPTGKIATTEV